MRVRSLLLLAVVAAVTLTSAAAAGSEAAKQRVSFDITILPQGKFVLTAVQAGKLKGDSGTVDGNWRRIQGQGRDVTRNGQTVTIYNPRWTLSGKRGTLTIRERAEWVDVGGDVDKDAYPDSIGLGTWKVVRGTGQYANLAGGGRSAHEGLGHAWIARFDGFLGAR